ncbi:MAG: LacI family DNA-binding transcriptional regulator, partial [Mobilitalea sp.]
EEVNSMITRKEIAQRAGVSVSVVSRALNNSGYVREDKREEILRVAEELGYRPNPVAMSLQKRRTKQILFYCKDLNNAFNIEMYQGMLEEAEKYGYMVVMHGKLNFNIVRDMMIDGLILPNQPITAIYLDEIGNNYHLPVVTASYGDDIYLSKAVPLIECDLLQGAKDALQYLWDKGHRKIAMVTPYDLITHNSRTIAWKEFMKPVLKDRMEDYFLGISRGGLHNDQRINQFTEEQSREFRYHQDSFYEKGMLAGDIFSERKMDATAVLCFNDEMAMGFAKRIKHFGYRIPEDISLMGFDGVVTGRYMEPVLTTMALHPAVMGAKCVQVMMSVLQGNKYKYVTHIPTKILEGESVKDLRVR